MWFCFALLLPALPQLKLWVKHLEIWEMMFLSCSADLQGCAAQGCAQGCRGVCRAQLGNGTVMRAGDTRGTSGVPSRVQGWCCHCCARLREAQEWEGTTVALLG